jgi:hypothetical protein
VAAGWDAALVKRIGNDVLGVGPQPQIVGEDLNDVADQLIGSSPGTKHTTGQPVRGLEDFRNAPERTQATDHSVVFSGLDRVSSPGGVRACERS